MCKQHCQPERPQQQPQRRAEQGGDPLCAMARLAHALVCAVYEVQSEGLDGEVKFFRKPWAMTTIMFMGMSLCLPLAFLEERQKAAAAAEEAAREPLLASHDNVPHVRRPPRRLPRRLRHPLAFSVATPTGGCTWG